MQRRPSRNYNQEENTGSGIWVIILLVLMIGIAAASKYNLVPESWETMADGNKQINLAGNIETETPASISRASAAKLIAYTFYSEEEINQLERNIEIEDTLPSFWYDKYINAVVNLGYMDGMDNKFYPGEPLTYKEVLDILGSLSKNKYSIKLKAKEEEINQKVSMQRFIDIYSKLLDKINKDNPSNKPLQFQEQKIIILSTPATDENLGPWKAATDQGEYSFEGLSLDAYMDQEIKVITKNNEILGVAEVTNKNPSLESAYITNVTKENVEILISGITKTYYTDLLDSSYIDKLVDIHLSDGQIVSVDIKEEEYKDRVIRIGDSYIETEKSGFIPVSDNLKIYDTTEEGVSWSKLNNIVVGTPDIEYTMENNKINTITVKKKPNMNNIRLLITTTEFKDKVHEDVIVKSSEPFTVDFYGETKSYQADEVLDIKQWAKKMSKEKPRITIKSLNTEQQSKPLLQIETIKRRDTYPIYPGTLEICKEDSGGYTVINEVSIEDYVASVIPSEMPTSYGLEACKV